MTALHALTASALSALFRSGQVTPSTVLSACLARHDEVNPALNAVVALDREAAGAAAADADARWAEGRPLSMLDGVPVTIKDNLQMRGLPATWGSRGWADSPVPASDELAVARLRQAGAVLLGKTNTPELALAGHTANDVFGSTGNPWDPGLTPGGSSGGAVAAVMGGIAPVALATDAGGSIRRPAGHAGAVGLRTTPGLVPRRGGFRALAGDLQTIGPIARSVEDLALTLDILAGPAGLAGAPLPPVGADTLAGRRVGVVGRIGDHPVEPEILRRLEETAAMLESLGLAVREIPCLVDPDEAGEIMMTLASVGVASALDEAPSQGFSPTPAIARLAESGRKVTGMAYCRQLWRISEIRDRVADLFADLDFVLTPSAAALPWSRTHAAPSEIDGLAAAPRASAIYTTFVNVAGLPALAFPAAPSVSGLPIGMQVVGPPLSEPALLALGRAVENASPWPRVATPRPAA
ncbi:MAG: amidase [Pseudomonadota bacterium]